ncbi:MAG: four helix bundle suffix domain-containing protein [Bacteroidales bacterium]|nr:four helix bundle suffix domain-containing protein [Bacteroidales bacterium]MBQ6742586.1 four helix bundle suffix domain-containing protein [Bacteroidales bacterium]MBQ6742587.1 four helix bundle suffix domain-containing protein [Bacteroidales bacterium]
MDQKYQILNRQMPFSATYYYQKSEVLYQLTFAFCRRFLPTHGDRTVDQMIQAARSGKQNIVEGTEDGVSSTEMQLKLLNVARASLQELREDYKDYLTARNLPIWDDSNPRFPTMRKFCSTHNTLDAFKPFLECWSDEEMANVALTLCHQTDSLLNKHLKRLESEFVEQGGIKERMYAARTGYRQQEQKELAQLRSENELLKKEISRLKDILKVNGIKY